MFKPGHLHRQRAPGVTDVPDYVVDVYYEVQEEPGEGLLLCLTMQGVVDGRAFTEQVRLHRDTAFNFAAVLGRLADRYGLPRNASPIMREHAEYDAMYRDIRERLGAVSGEPVDFAHLEQDLRQL